MAKLEYDKDGRLLFTKEMKQEYTILAPQMLPVHFNMISQCFNKAGYKLKMLDTNHRGIVDTGLKYVHNDTCYPALLVIGQLIDALQSGEYDQNKTALMITQTGGGCRASNYIHLLRKALKKSGLEHVPVISLNLSGLEKNPGFKLSLGLLMKTIYCLAYGDLIMTLRNHCMAYEVTAGDSQKMADKWENIIVDHLGKRGGLSYKKFKIKLTEIVKDFTTIELDKSVRKPKIGVVGEIFVKYSPLGNNNLEEFLFSEGCEVVVPGVIDFVIFKIDNRGEDVKLYGGSRIKGKIVDILQNFTISCQTKMREIIEEHSDFEAPVGFEALKKGVKGYLGYGNKMGEGWLLTSEMIELTLSGADGIVCAQPFGCLPNHVAGKGMISLIRRNLPSTNIVAIDYDPGATKINQENRIKLMLANAKKTLSE